MNKDVLDVKEWVRYAQTDYDCARKMADMFHPIPIEIVCYHCQQSVEKILKAYVIAKDNTLTKTHDLVILLKQCRQHSSEFDRYAEVCMAITMYVSTTRYPSEIELTEQHMKLALKDTLEILEFTKSKLVELGFEIK
jgi:HEPN domain-containing protein